MSRRNVLGFGFTIALLIANVQASAGTIYMATDRFGYTGSITRYASLADAQSGMNPLGTFTVGQRDLSIVFLDNAPNTGDDFYQTLTAWFHTIDGASPGVGNPSNQNEGFVQIFDDGHSSVTSFEALFTNPELTEYRLRVNGANADAVDEFGRLGPMGSNAFDRASTAGTFLTYELDATFSNLNPAEFNPFDEAFESFGDPEGVAVSGTFSGIVLNQNNAAPSFNGFYTFNFNLNTTSWAYDNRDSLSDPEFMTSFYASSSVIPEPSGLVLASIGGGIGVIAAGWRGRRKTQQGTTATR